MNQRRWRSALAALLALGLVATVAACGGDDDSDEGVNTIEAVDGPTIRMAPQDFAEAKTLTEVYAQYLESQGFDVDLQAASGFRDQVYPALEGDSLDLIIDYTGSAAGFLNPDAAKSADPDASFAALQAELGSKGLVAYDYAEAEDANALVVLKSVADEQGLTKISDLAKLGTVKLGGAEDCRERTDCLLGYQDPAKYGLTIDFTALEYGPALTEGLSQGVIQAAQYQTTAPQIASGDFVVLEDDKGLLSADNIVPVLRQALDDAYGDQLREAIDTVTEALTTDDLVAWNVRTDIDKDEPADVAKDWLEEKGLLS
jgi:osmoprotectant transport system substrate-binding protein